MTDQEYKDGLAAVFLKGFNSGSIEVLAALLTSFRELKEIGLVDKFSLKDIVAIIEGFKKEMEKG